MCSLGDRMKTYEAVSKGYLMRRTPVIIRIDGCHFHTFTRNFDKPFDRVFIDSMQWTMWHLCNSIQGCVLGYTQSDEISLVLCDYKRLESAAWFDDQIQKICSVSASLASMFFRMAYDASIEEYEEAEGESFDSERYHDAYFFNPAYFDARCFNLPKEEVCNYMIWRQQDAERNSILGLSQALYTHKELQGIKCKELQDKMFTEKGVNWNDLETCKKRGACAIKGEKRWRIDYDIPIFTQDRSYVEQRITFNDEES